MESKITEITPEAGDSIGQNNQPREEWPSNFHQSTLQSCTLRRSWTKFISGEGEDGRISVKNVPSRLKDAFIPSQAITLIFACPIELKHVKVWVSRKQMIWLTSVIIIIIIIIVVVVVMVISQRSTQCWYEKNNSKVLFSKYLKLS